LAYKTLVIRNDEFIKEFIGAAASIHTTSQYYGVEVHSALVVT